MNIDMAIIISLLVTYIIYLHMTIYKKIVQVRMMVHGTIDALAMLLSELAKIKKDKGE